MPTQKYRATVTNLDDPDKEGKFKVTCPELILNSDEELVYWVIPELQHGWFTVPYIGQQVIIEIDRQYDDENENGIQNFVMSTIIKWKGEVPFTDKEYDNSYIIDDKFKTNYKNKRGYVTKKGHYIIFDDTDDDESISIVCKYKNKNESSIVLDKTGSIIIEDSKNNVVVLNSKDDNIDILHHSGTEIKLSSTSIDIIAQEINSTAQTENNMTSEGTTNISGININITSDATINVSSPVMNIDADLLNLKQGALRPLLKSPEFCAIFDTHVHNNPSEAPGFTGTPTIKITPIISTFTEPTILS